MKASVPVLLSMVTLFAMPTASATTDTDTAFAVRCPVIRDVDIVAVEFVSSDVAASRFLAADVSLVNVCAAVRPPPAGVCSYSSGPGWERIYCIVGVDGLGVCIGWSYYKDASGTYISCWQRVGL